MILWKPTCGKVKMELASCVNFLGAERATLTSSTQNPTHVYSVLISKEMFLELHCTMCTVHTHWRTIF